MSEAYIYIPKDVTIPPLYSCEKVADPLAQIKLFTPDSSWTWYVLEYDPIEQLAFGLVVGHEVELGYFSLAELKEVKGHLGLNIERDISFKPTLLSELKRQHP